MKSRILRYTKSPFQNGVDEVRDIFRLKDIVELLFHAECRRLKSQRLLTSVKLRIVLRPTLPFIFDTLTENKINFVRMWLFVKLKNIVNSRKLCFNIVSLGFNK